MALPRIVAEFRKYRVEAEAAETVSEALSLALTQAGTEDLVCVASSLFVVAEAIEHARALHLMA